MIEAKVVSHKWHHDVHAVLHHPLVAVMQSYLRPAPVSVAHVSMRMALGAGVSGATGFMRLALGAGVGGATGIVRVSIFVGLGSTDGPAGVVGVGVSTWNVGRR